jgi:hypothetical protein
MMGDIDQRRGSALVESGTNKCVSVAAIARQRNKQITRLKGTRIN